MGTKSGMIVKRIKSGTKKRNKKATHSVSALHRVACHAHPCVYYAELGHGMLAYAEKLVEEYSTN